MIELEIILNDLQKMLEKEKGLRNKILLQDAISSLKEYDKAIAARKEEDMLKRKK